MSWEATAWAAKQRCGSPQAKLVLFALANRHNADTGQCDPSIERIADEAEISKRTVYRVLDDLETAGFISRERRAGGMESGSQSNLYRFPALEGESDRLAPSVGERASEGDNDSATTGSTGTERENRKIEKEEEGTDLADALAQYHVIAEQVGLAKIVKLSDSRKASLKARLKEHGADVWRAAMRSIPESGFLTGRDQRGDREWKPDFDWFVNPNNFLKLIEGKYHNGKPVKPAPATPDLLSLPAPIVFTDTNAAGWEQRIGDLYEIKLWRPQWGPKPGEQGCKVPDAIICRWVQRLGIAKGRAA